MARNAPPAKDDPPVWFTSATSLDKLYLAQRDYLAKLRGFDRLAPEADMNGGVMPVPRSTNAEVIKLAEFWSRMLTLQKAKNESGYDTVLARWRAVLADVEKLAHGAEPSAVYPKNHAFWRAAHKPAAYTARKKLSSGTAIAMRLIMLTAINTKSGDWPPAV